MHALGASLLRATARGESALLHIYNNFARAVLRMRRQIATLRAELEAALSNLDALTGVSNRIAMLASLREQQELVRRGVMPCGIAMVDLDHFKAVNDTHGHLVGDRVLVACTRHLQALLSG
jgi:PleD family two-component response regulator